MQDEIDRLNISHEAFQTMFDRRLIFPPVSRLRRVLECGFGTGAWASEVAMENPNCQVCFSFC